jgi:hypothetical protein
MYRNDAKLYDGDLFAILTLILLPCVLFVLWWVLIYSLPPKNLPETSKYYRTAPRMLSLSFWIMGVGRCLTRNFRRQLGSFWQGGFALAHSWERVVFSRFDNWRDLSGLIISLLYGQSGKLWDT